ncbi:1-acyl-sn-glycerol-3-phosphate acyltransferase [Psychrosphaera aquimarina]|uniref:1-acyl-sn-glycerol-3-phosphate acyltransferase n=1 Tax=Psychrosphaera aquimarina TaxID=2044854 RepID=A0ABU3R489_9GAMM|nr:1-acyl-sn-glycerol-3-phosphate acyltransferase [Psychrosphaera aquimarina]MDU0114484.1 1-acyl-sn-glycerol-3-phosphate acyltransferase [Psychrosphaera aquimarina]
MRANRFAQMFSFIVMSTIKILTHIFYKFEVKWLSEKQFKQLDNVKLVVLLNHTSLYEALFVRLAPFSFLWRIARHMLVPVADVTTKRPLVGMFFHALVPGVVPISRKRDASWRNFLTQINDDSIVAILPEGRMRRHDGFDKHGKPMSVRAGVADIIEQIDSGDILFVYSGGLHHIQVPGQAIPKLFKKIKTHMEVVSVDDYKDALYHPEVKNRKVAFVRDIQKRLNELTPYCEDQPYHRNNSDK